MSATMLGLEILGSEEFQETWAYSLWKSCGNILL